ncbi:ribbon-helix-helix domain-containing protein [Iningainema tapete]|uniref:Type II toxin-antitoxin system ParD family antitoxin n=1 Tax=Iningainema tapete BLCC-T55 TaxID=2748662 RepID=A0A8J6XFS6_9CYAN|nr:type II toxin-antitoxin system ParD family antitoxin [Iningainema tapete]MBD2770749.1 type II toxin-antitoxin system ParD family antitoxin [Iningainema tapete BLCC-T55]
MNISLNSDQEQFIQELLKSGEYETIDEVIAQAFRLLKDNHTEYQKWIEETREKVDSAVAQLERGEGIDGEVVVERLREKLRKAREKQA